MTDIQAWLDHGKTLADQATEGPWAAWTDQDGTEHMQGRLMVGNAAAVIPEGESWVEGVDINPVAHVNTGEDRAFIADARTRLPQALAALQAVHDLHKPVEVEPSATICTACSNRLPNGRFMPIVEYPCPPIEAIQAVIGDTE